REGRFRRASLHGDTDNPAREQHMIRVWHCRPHRHCVRRRVDLDIEKVTQPGVRVDGAVGQLDANVDMRVLPGFFGSAPKVVEKIALADLEGGIDRSWLTMVASFLEEGWTRLPSVTMARPMRPSMGE